MPGLGALSFTTPLILSALALLPVLWWLLRTTPPAPQQVWFPGFMLLERLADRKQTPERTPWWLLLLRLLLAALIILGLARPVLNAPPTETGDEPLVVVVDNSFAAAPGWRQREELTTTLAAEARQSDRALYLLPTAPDRKAPRDRIEGPLTPAAFEQRIKRLPLSALRADRSMADDLAEALGRLPGDLRPRIVYLTDHLASADQAVDRAFLTALSEAGSLSVYVEAGEGVLAVDHVTAGDSDGLTVRIRRSHTDGPWAGTLVARTRTGRELDRQPVALPDGDVETRITIDLPLALRNDLARLDLEGRRQASAVWLTDARDRRALIGLVPSSREESAALLTGNHYVRQAMAPYAEFQSGSIGELVAANVSVIVLDDVGRLRDDEQRALTGWVEAGGVLIRFAGPRLADAALDTNPPLLPVALRRGERALGGTLTWDTPQPLGSFEPEGPFAGLAIPDDVVVRQQVLAEPGGETSARTWASLADGTPIVTGLRQGRGLIALVHTTATPSWADLSLSEVFIDMMRKLTFLAVVSPDMLKETVSDRKTARYAPVRMLTGRGELVEPAPSLAAITLGEAAQGPSLAVPPGLYGSVQTPVAINAVPPEAPLDSMDLRGVPVQGYALSPPTPLSPPLFLFAVLLLLADAMATLFLQRGLVLPGAAKSTEGDKAAAPPAMAAGLALACLLGVLLVVDAAHAQPPLDPPIDERTAAAALETRFAWVRSDDAQTNRLAEMGLASLSRELSRRTTVSPALPVAIDPAEDDLSVYPVIYWPVEPGDETLPDEAFANIENFMRLGGLVIFDTRDEERALPGQETPEAVALRKILTRMNIPPLVQLPEDHVLTRSYYLIPDLRGRTEIEPVWVARSQAINDGVTPLIIGGRDWIGAWARDGVGTPVRPMLPSARTAGERAREFALRAGINMAMVAFTGNYKTDQVHTGILLRRLGRPDSAANPRQDRRP